MKKLIVLLMSFVLLSGFSFPNSNRTVIVRDNPDSTIQKMSTLFNGLGDWSFDKELNAWVNTGFELYLNDDMTKINYILLRDLSIDTTYNVMNIFDLYPTPMTRYILEYDTGFLSDMYVEDDYLFVVSTFKPLHDLITIGIYYEEEHIQEIMDANYIHLTGTNTLQEAHDKAVDSTDGAYQEWYDAMIKSGADPKRLQENNKELQDKLDEMWK